jgi:diguanylate cyclase
VTLDGTGVAYVVSLVVASVMFAAIVYGTSRIADRLAAARLEAALAAEFALRDALTGVHSRHALEVRFDQELARARRGDRRLAVYFLDLDGFKTVNDTFGHAVGDALLRAFAARIQATVRSYDTVGRMGGDEFVVLASVVDDREAHALAERMMAACAEPVDVDGTAFGLEVSIGVAMHPGDGDDRPALLRAADAAMYAAKASGRNRWAAYGGHRARLAQVGFGGTRSTAVAASSATALSVQSAAS